MTTGTVSWQWRWYYLISTIIYNYSNVIVFVFLNIFHVWANVDHIVLQCPASCLWKEADSQTPIVIVQILFAQVPSPQVQLKATFYILKTLVDSLWTIRCFVTIQHIQTTGNDHLSTFPFVVFPDWPWSTAAAQMNQVLFVHLIIQRLQ